MDIFRLASDSLGVFNTRQDKSKKPCSCHTDTLFGGDITDSAILSDRFGFRIPSYKAGPSLPLPYSGKALPRQSSFGNFFWNHAPDYQGSVFKGDRRPNTSSSVAPQVTVPPKLKRPVVATVNRGAYRTAPQPPLRRPPAPVRARTFTSKPDIFAGTSSPSHQTSSLDWDGLWQN